MSEQKKRVNFYPFGLKHKGYNNNINGVDHPYGFNGKEEQNDFNEGLGWIDITARNYDPALGRWMNIDPLAEMMRRHSPYNYAFDNPIFYVDPDGMMPIGLGEMDEESNFDFKPDDGPNHITSTVVDEGGKIIDHRDDGDDNIYLNERSEENIIGTEREGVEYNEGNYLYAEDINESAYSKLPSSFLVNLPAPGMTILELPWYMGSKGAWKTININNFWLVLKTFFKGGILKVNIGTLVNGEEKAGNVIKLLKKMEADAKAAGAKKIIIEGTSIIETRLMNTSAWERLGYQVEKLTENSITVIKNLK